MIPDAMIPDAVSVRDFFAATVGTADLMAINPESQEQLMGKAFDHNWPIQKQIDYNMAVEALLRYRYADAMMAERDRYMARRAKLLRE